VRTPRESRKLATGLVWELQGLSCNIAFETNLKLPLKSENLETTCRPTEVTFLLTNDAYFAYYEFLTLAPFNTKISVLHESLADLVVIVYITMVEIKHKCCDTFVNFLVKVAFVFYSLCGIQQTFYPHLPLSYFKKQILPSTAFHILHFLHALHKIDQKRKVWHKDFWNIGI